MLFLEIYDLFKVVIVLSDFFKFSHFVQANPTCETLTSYFLSYFIVCIKHHD